LHQLAAGDFEVRLNSGRQDEIGRAIQAFNHTARHLSQARSPRLSHADCQLADAGSKNGS
jgi:hypothetical protein